MVEYLPLIACKPESGEFNFTIDNESVTEDNNVTNGKGTRKKKIDTAYDYYNWEIVYLQRKQCIRITF